MATSQRLRHHSQLWALVALAVVVSAIAAPVAASTQRWIVPGDVPVPAGSLIVGSFPLADALVIEAPSAPAGAVSYDEALSTSSLPPRDAETGMRVDTGVASTGAPAVWDSGELGDRAVVALIDTGVAPVPALEDSVVGEIDFSGTGGGDGYGHGTFLASLIAGNHADAPGVAPHAGILSLKVAGDTGTTTLGPVLAAMQWLHGAGRAGGIRVATLALGVDPDSDAARLLDQASNALANAGVLVVTAAGNDGAGNLTSPATATGTFSVGATDDQGTVTTTDDVVADFSATGTDRNGVAQPDMLASGTKVVSWMSHDSQIAVDHPEAAIEPNLFRGSGTSMSTALTAGVAALASSARPDLDGTALADALRASGAIVDAPTVVAAAEAAPAGKARGFNRDWESPLAPGSNGKRKGHADQADPQGIRWAGIRWAGIRWAGIRWAGIRWADDHWTGIRWAGIRWANGHWGDETWAPGAWGSIRWSEDGWAGDVPVEPEGIRWAGIRWAGIRWASVRWSGIRWAMLEAPRS